MLLKRGESRQGLQCGVVQIGWCVEPKKNLLWTIPRRGDIRVRRHVHRAPHGFKLRLQPSHHGAAEEEKKRYIDTRAEKYSGTMVGIVHGSVSFAVEMDTNGRGDTTKREPRDTIWKKITAGAGHSSANSTREKIRRKTNRKGESSS